MSPPRKEKTLASIYSVHLERRSSKKLCRNKLNNSAIAGSVIDNHVSGDTVGEEEGNSSEKAIVKVKLEKQEEPTLLVACGIQKRKRLSLGENTRKFAEHRESSLEGLKKTQPRLGNRWNTERIKFAEQTLAEVMKELGASFETPMSRFQLRTIARKKIGDTGLLDHSLKHIDGKVTPGGADRFRRCYNTDGAMQYWLESADLVKIKRESGTPDPNWIPPSWWKIQSASHDSSPISSKLFMGEIEKLKSDIKELASKQRLPDQADATEKLYKEFISWRVNTDKQIVEISNSLTSTQCMFKDMVSWKNKVEQQLVGISNSLKNLQANGSTSFSPATESWALMLMNANLDDFTENGFEPWDDLIDGLPEAIRPETYSLPPNPCKSSCQGQTCSEEQSLVNLKMPKTESCLTRGESRNSSQDKADTTSGSSMTAGPKSDIDNPTILSQVKGLLKREALETLKELVTWKAKAEQQLTEISNAVHALNRQNQPNWLYP